MSRLSTFVFFFFLNFGYSAQEESIAKIYNLKDDYFDFNVTGEGFHREISFASSSLPVSLASCNILLKWSIPAGVYVDPYQLQSSVRNGTAHFSSHIDIEQMAHHSTSFLLHILPNLDCDSIRCSFAHHMQVHSRYHLPKANQFYATVNMAPPTVFSSCSPCSSEIPDALNKCVWQEMPKPKFVGHTFLIPVGELSHTNIVTSLTMLISFLGTGYISWIAMTN